MTATADEKLAASVFALGLSHGFIRREDVVQWADRRIAESDSPPGWLIDLSLSQPQKMEDLLSDLRRTAEDVDPVATCEAVYSLLPDISGFTFDQAEALAGLVYRITYACLRGDWSKDLLSATDNLADQFEFVRNGYVTTSKASVIGAVNQFVQAHCNQAIARLLHPVRWSLASDEGPRQTPTVAGP